MPNANYRCGRCHTTILYVNSTLPTEIDEAHRTAPTASKPSGDLCRHRSYRCWGGKENAPAIGQVPGAGGSPARG